MILDTAKMLMGIDMLTETLLKGPLTVTFTKQDGTERIMRCTKDLNLIPVDKLPKPKFPTDVVVIKDPQLFVVWDLDKQAWRSFNYTTVKTIALL